MARYIDVEKKIKEMNMKIESITRLIENRPYDEEAKLMLREFKYSLAELIDTPTVEAVEVVRCGECKHYNDSRCSKISYIMDGYYQGSFEVKTSTDFCSGGERRDT